MLKPITFTVEFEDAGESVSHVVTASGTDYSAFEERYGMSSLVAIQQMMYRAWTFIPWHALHRQGITSMSYEEFEALTPDVDPEARVTEPDPLESIPPSGTSPS